MVNSNPFDPIPPTVTSTMPVVAPVGTASELKYCSNLMEFPLCR